MHGQRKRQGFGVSYRGKTVSVYRGGNGFTLKAGEYKINPETGLVRTTHGASLDVNPNTVSKFGGAFEVKAIPNGLKVIQRGQRAEHFEIVPAYEMPLGQYQNLLNQIKITPVK